MKESECSGFVASPHYVANPQCSRRIMAAHSVLIGRRHFPRWCTTQWVREDENQAELGCQLKIANTNTQQSFLLSLCLPSFYKDWKIKALCECWRTAVGEEEHEEQTQGFREMHVIVMPSLLKWSHQIFISNKMSHLCCVFSHCVLLIHKVRNKNPPTLFFYLLQFLHSRRKEKGPFKGSFIIHKLLYFFFVSEYLHVSCEAPQTTPAHGTCCIINPALM